MAWENVPPIESNAKFDAVHGFLEFIYTFKERTELTGYFKLKLWLQAIGNEDIDIFTKFSKLSKDGTLLEINCIDVGYLADDPEANLTKLRQMHSEGNKHVDVFFAEGGHGRLRVSHRELDTKRSSPHQPFYTHKNPQILKHGEIVPVNIELWPCGMIWEAGEKIRLSVAGHNQRPELTVRTPPVKTINKGEIVIFTGGTYDSHLLVPFIPDSQ